MVAALITVRFHSVSVEGTESGREQKLTDVGYGGWGGRDACKPSACRSCAGVEALLPFSAWASPTAPDRQAQFVECIWPRRRFRSVSAQLSFASTGPTLAPKCPLLGIAPVLQLSVEHQA